MQAKFAAHAQAKLSANRETIHSAQFFADDTAFGAAKYQFPDRKTNSAAICAAHHAAQLRTVGATHECSQRLANSTAVEPTVNRSFELAIGPTICASNRRA